MIQTLEDLTRLPKNVTIWPRGFAYPITKTVPGEPAGLEWNAPGENIGHTAAEIPLPAAVIHNPWSVIERPEFVMTAHEESECRGCDVGVPPHNGRGALCKPFTPSTEQEP